MKSYIPKQSDFVVATFDPQTGHEQAGRRPALVISKQDFNQATGLAMICPITNTDRNFPFHIPVPLGKYLKILEYMYMDQFLKLEHKTRNYL